MARRTRLASGAATLAAAAVLVVLALVRTQNLAHEDEEQPAPVRTVPIAENAVQLRVELARRDQQQRPWEGEVTTSEGRVLGVDILRASMNSTTDGPRFQVRARRAGAQARPQQRRNLLSAILHVRLDAPPAATVTIRTSHGEFSFRPADLTAGETVDFLDGHASVERQEPSLRLTGPNTEDDHPALARARDGTVWLAYVEYRPGPPIIMPQVANRRFDTLEPRGHGDQIKLGWFDGREWRLGLEVTERGLDVWRPTIAVGGEGRVVVSWAQKVDDNWDIYSRTYTPGRDKASGTWSDVVRVTDDPGTDFNVVSTTDANGKVWLAWQGWRDGHFQIMLAPASGSRRSAPQVLAVQPKEGPPANHWSPSLTSDSKGNVYVAWDVHLRGSYDVYLATISAEGRKVVPVAESPRFEARPHIACDSADRLWIAYEEGDVLWGQDYQGNAPDRVGIGENPGSGLYVNRTVRVKCLADGQLQQPAADLQAALRSGRLARNKSHPRLTVDEAGGVWLLFRHHPLSGGAGETWHSYAVRYEGDGWSEPRELPSSSNILDNRPALVPHGKGILAVHSSDRRTRTQDRDQDDLYATKLAANGDVAAPELEPAASPEVAAPDPVHPNEADDIARLRAARVTIGGRELRFLRGEFHRHTEYTAHRDQDGSLEDSWRYALDAARLDWMGNGDHDNGLGHEYLWWQIQKICDLYHNPPHFVAAMTYERSVRYPSGHRNVMFPRRGIRPLPRLSNQQPILFGTAEEGSPDIKMLYDYLRHFGAICASHTSGTGMGTDWRDHDPEVEPIVEIYQGHRHNYERPAAPRSATAETQIGGFEPAGFVHHALLKGHRLGFQASSDHVSTHMSYAIVLAEDTSRQAILDAFRKRHCYGATDNILLVVRSGEHLMGDELETPRRPRLEIEAHGTTPIARVYVVRSDQYVFTAEPGEREVTLTYTDMDVKPGDAHYYYVRVEQTDGNIAWASPMWITYRP